MVAILVGLFTSFNAARYLAETVTETLGMVLIMQLILLKSVIALEVLVPIAFYSAHHCCPSQATQGPGSSRAQVCGNQ